MNIPISGAFIPIPSPWNRGEPCFNGLVCGKIYRKPGFLTWNVCESGFKCPLNPSSDWCATHLPASAGRWVRSSKAPVAHRATMASLINFLGAAKFYGSEVLCAYLKWPFLNPCMSIWILHRCICIDIHMYYNMYYICITYVLHMYNTSCGMERKDLRKCTLFRVGYRWCCRSGGQSWGSESQNTATRVANPHLSWCKTRFTEKIIYAWVRFKILDESPFGDDSTTC